MTWVLMHTWLLMGHVTLHTFLDSLGTLDFLCALRGLKQMFPPSETSIPNGLHSVVVMNWGFTVRESHIQILTV